MQNVGTPRFYIDSGLYQQAIGVWTPDDDQKSLVQLNPTNIVGKPTNQIIVPRISPITYIAFLGHNGGSYYPSIQGLIDDPSTTDINESTNAPDDFEEIINMNGYNEIDEPYSGFSIGIFSDSPDATGVKGVIGNDDSTLGAVSIGDYYDMPHSPDLNLKLSYEYDGVKNIQTKGGATLSNASYTKPADWGDAGAWQLKGNPNYRSGRRSWDLSFSFLSSESVMPENAGSSIYAGDGVDNFETNILDGTDFFSQVWNKTMGGHLPFIFNPSGGGTSPNNSPDQFAICRFDQKSLKLSQVSPNTYNVKLKIRESW